MLLIDNVVRGFAVKRGIVRSDPFRDILNLSGIAAGDGFVPDEAGEVASVDIRMLEIQLQRRRRSALVPIPAGNQRVGLVGALRKYRVVEVVIGVGNNDLSPLGITGSLKRGSNRDDPRTDLVGNICVRLRKPAIHLFLRQIMLVQVRRIGSIRPRLMDQNLGLRCVLSYQLDQLFDVRVVRLWLIAERALLLNGDEVPVVGFQFPS